MNNQEWMDRALTIISNYKLRLIGECKACQLPLVDDDPYNVVHKINDEYYCEPCYRFLKRLPCVICKERPRIYNAAFCYECAPSPYYIYSWTAPDDPNGLPMYIGYSGNLNRINQIHFKDSLNMYIAKCEAKRQEYEEIIYRVLEEGLTKERALELEGVYYWRAVGMGATLMNEVVPKQPQVKKEYVLQNDDISIQRFNRKTK